MNWGNKIVVSLITFMFFIGVLVFFMIQKHGDDALVEEDYYEKGLNFDQEIQKNQNVIDDKAKPIITVTQNQLIIQLKDSANYKMVLLRPSNKKDDLKFEGNTVSKANLITINSSELNKGMWFLNIEWTSNNKLYQHKQNITL